jgi:hypothetical protein
MRVLIPPAEPQRLALARPLKLARSYLNLRIRLRIEMLHLLRLMPAFLVADYVSHHRNAASD